MNEPLAIPLGVLFTILFTLVGPIRMLPAFDALTRSMDARERRSLALRSTSLALLGIVLAAFLGTAQITNIGISPEALGTAAGIILTLVGLLPLVGFERRVQAASGPVTPLSLAFPVLLPPHAFGLIILFSLYAGSLLDTAGIVTVGLALMILNFIAMISARWMMETIGMTPLRIFGAVFGIIQLAFGIQILFWGVANGIAAQAMI